MKARQRKEELSHKVFQIRVVRVNPRLNQSDL
jgi:hypothetical protein